MFLSFRTPEGGTDGLAQTGAALLGHLGEAIAALGFSVDFTPGRNEPDWVFAAGRGGVSFTVVLSATSGGTDGWFVGLEAADGTWLVPPAAGGDVHPALEAAVRSVRGVTGVRWHADHTTLRGP